MRLLAFSDIHHNLVAVRKLRAAETNSFDAIVVAGDVGSKSAGEFFKIVRTFKCPVLYVYGNWDHELSYSTSFGSNCHLVHSGVITLGNLHFTGFSGCPTNWGKNPIAQRIWRELRRDHKPILEKVSKIRSLSTKQPKLADYTKAGRSIDRLKKTKAYQKYAFHLRLAKGEILRLNRERVAKAIKSADLDPRRCIVVTHERLARLSEEIPGTLLHLYGHIHKFSDRSFKGTRYVDVAALDRPILVAPSVDRDSGDGISYHGNAGNYVIIEISRSLEVAVKTLTLDYQGAT